MKIITSGHDEVESAYRRWLYHIPKPSSKPVGVDTAEIFKMAWEIIEKSHAPTRLKIIKTLASEEGLMVIKALTDQMTDKAPSSMLNLFVNRTLPFYRIISHFEVLSSLVLETELETIFNFLFGPNGRRAVPVFRFTANALNEMVKRDMGVETEYSMALTATVAILRQIIDLNQTALLIDDFQDIMETICSSIPCNLPLETAHREIRRVKERLGIGAAIEEKEPAKAHVQPAVFELDQDLPGSLSHYGPRHDNDHDDIWQIKILPTADEIISDRPEYLPSANSANGHLTGVDSLLDRQFRLLREDTIGHIRDTIRMERKILSQPRQDNPNNKSRHFTYHNACLRAPWFPGRSGLAVVVEFDQPKPLRNKGKNQTEKWWEESKRLRAGTLVALVSKGMVMFFSVGQTESGQQSGHPSLHSDPRRATVSLDMVDPGEEDITWVCTNLAAGHPQSLIELPSILLASFKPTLQALQKMIRSSQIPFSEFLTQEPGEAELAHVPPPAYAQAPGFAFKLACLRGNETLSYTAGKPFDYRALHTKSTLDQSQQAALINALSRRVALIQGPPGTGKSYTGVATIKTVLESKRDSFGPIICVCYTNHALDQLLEHLLDQKVHNIIRMGSRSKSEVLRKLNLHERCKNITQDWEERKEKAVQFKCLEECELEIKGILRGIHDPSSWKSIRDHLQRRHTDHFSQLFADDYDESGFQEVRGPEDKAIARWLNGGSEGFSNRPVSELLSVSVWNTSRAERIALHAHWIDERMAELTQRLLSNNSRYNEAKSRLDKYHQEQNIRCLREADVIGVTTTGLARNIDNLSRVGAKVVVCEEAGEVLEAHLLTALLPTVEHLVLIGDHQQLRPQVNTYELQHDHPNGERLSFDISLFERLVHPHPQAGSPKLPYSTLEVQRRMHPSIAELVRSTLYPALKDHSQVAEYPRVDGMRRRLFWWDHQHKEDAALPPCSAGNTLSKTNSFETGMVTTLVSYLIRQGTFQPEDIAVLTPYLGQLHQLRRQLSSSFEIVLGEPDIDDLVKNGLDIGGMDGSEKVQKMTPLGAIRAATVDNFQGEEAKVVIISLVRSNPERRCGFLKTSNRINVLLSRARHGMYIIGNRETAESVPMWKDVTSILEKEGNIGTGLELQCARHKDTPIEVKNPDDFAVFAPEGGCNKKCAWRLRCGHACINKCHSEILHSVVRCLERCPRTRDGCDHPCTKPCGDPCPTKCPVPVPNVTLSCGHAHDSLPCYQAQSLESRHCKTPVEVPLPHCEHAAQVMCSQLPLGNSYKCRAICGAALLCGHTCKRQCHECIQIENEEIKRGHGECTAICDRPYATCGHSCKQPCHGDEPCPLCEESCEVHCAHSRCKKKCHEPCAPCAEECSWSCPHHGKCQLPCAVPCDRLPCSKRCEETLECGHQCPSVCGEECPNKKYCQVCGDASVKGQTVDYILGEKYAEVNLDENPCLIPSCGHILTMESMDGHLEFSSYYELSDDPGCENDAVGLKHGSAAFTLQEVKTCPMCRGPLRNINRYGRIVRRALIGEATKRFIVWANAKIVPLAKDLDLCEAELAQSKVMGRNSDRWTTESEITEATSLSGDSAEQLKVVWGVVRSDKTFRSAFNLRGKIKRFLHEVGEKEQPFKRVYDLRQDYYKHRETSIGPSELQNGSEMLQVRNRLLATTLLLRCEYAIFANFLSFKGGNATVDFQESRATCESLVRECERRKQPRCQVEGLLFWARFAALEYASNRGGGQESESGCRAQAKEYLETAKVVCTKHPGQTRGLMAEVDQTEKTLREQTFYVPVTNDERAAVYEAMQRDFRGTGHWYYCQNGHPFTVGECGMPMQSSRCPECGSRVGGHSHQFADGITRAEDMDNDFARLDIQ